MRWRRRAKRTMYITGANGFLGRHLVEQSEHHEWELLAPSSSMIDVRDRDRVIDDITTWRPQVVVHLAYRRDDRSIIVDGSRHVAEAAAAAGARLIHLSTDVVFGGRPAPYVEADPLDPITDYGRWKAEAEGAVAQASPGAAILRTSLLYDTQRGGHCVDDVRRALAGPSGARSSMAFFTDEVRCPAHAADVAAAICHLADRPDIAGPLHVAGPDALSRAEFAGLIARWLGHDPGRLSFGSLADSGLVRPGVVKLDSSWATELGITCRSVEAAMSLNG